MSYLTAESAQSSSVRVDNWGVDTEPRRRTKPDARCVIDRTRGCGQCIAPSPAECPYVYLLDLRGNAGAPSATAAPATDTVPEQRSA